jgi:hypothetical protein
MCPWSIVSLAYCVPVPGVIRSHVGRVPGWRAGAMKMLASCLEFPPGGLVPGVEGLWRAGARVEVVPGWRAGNTITQTGPSTTSRLNGAAGYEGNI